jgi:hypothetical protein
MAEARKWVVTLSGERPLDAVRRDMEEAGFKAGHVLEAIGVVTGECDPEAAAKLRQVAGVADVSPDSPIDLGPPDSPTTW